MMRAPLKVLERVIDDPMRGIETKLCVFDMAVQINVDGLKTLVDYTAQVYRRRGGAGDFQVVHTTESCSDEYAALSLARTWHRRFPAVMKLTNKRGEEL